MHESVPGAALQADVRREGIALTAELIGADRALAVRINIVAFLAQLARLQAADQAIRPAHNLQVAKAEVRYFGFNALLLLENIPRGASRTDRHIQAKFAIFH